eukprot:COSAG06_NODE_22682_length_716_cov_0.764992_1_plen_25_part_01
MGRWPAATMVKFGKDLESNMLKKWA